MEPRFFTAVSFSGGLAIVELGNSKWAYINRKGEFVWRSDETE